MMDTEIRPLTSLRFFAALYVFVFHIHIRWPLAEVGTAAHQLLSQGAVGMTLFFILSGFVLGYRYSAGLPQLRIYMLSRVTRLYPVYAIAAVTTVPWLLSTMEQMPQGDLRWAQYAFVIIANVTMTQAWFPPLFSIWNNGASWSISAEVFFYTIFMIFLPWQLSLSKNRNKLILCILALASAAGGACLLLFPDETSPLFFYSLPIFRLPEFLIGVILGVMFSRGYRISYSGSMFCGGILALIGFLAWGPTVNYTYVGTNFVSVPLLSLIIVAAASSNSIVKSILSVGPLRFMGMVSYSFYSFQALVILLLIDHHADIVSSVPLLGQSWILCVSAFAVLTAIAALSYQLIEVRLRDVLLDFASPNTR